ncbi:hypothetical protein [Shewanella sp. NKUCC06_TVS]|uniref:hypothetical protein n=1 Tax=Shewanella sp. NKUCC06_TVS TaxID=2842128 RepID=UPI001C5AD9B1|nr:hypothetical protein [Shewanella sp. NKUCC06_TVS]MBW3532234.1 hypothetical protein [Shewanella sp. NKUCC06_TVS]
MNILIVIVGLGLACTGALLSWNEKKSMGIWATYAFGFLLVLTSGPISNSLQGFSLTGKGLDVKFTEISPESSIIEAISTKAQESIKSLSLSSASDNNFGVEVTNTYTKDIVEKLIPFIQSLGYTPTQIVGSPNIRPGSIVTISNKGLSLWATPQEAFPKLLIQSSAVALPTFQFSYPLPSQESFYKFIFECGEGAVSEEASLSGLMGSWNKTLSQRALNSTETFVVQSVLLCSSLQMASSLRGNGSNESRQDFDFSTKDKVVIGYKLVKMDFGNSE